MKRISIVLLSTSLLMNIVLAADNIVATYKGGKVTDSQVMQQFQPILAAQQLDKDTSGKEKKFGELDCNLQETLVRAYINVQLIKQQVISENIESTKEFKEKLANIKNQVAQQELIDRYIKTHVTEDMINTEYKKLIDNLKGKDEVKVSHILVETKEKADSIKDLLNKGKKTFSELAKIESKDDGSKDKGGDIGYVTEGQLVPEFEKAAFSLKKNEISKPVKTSFGWHIITILDRRAAKTPSKEEARFNITNKLSKEVIEKYFTDLANKADIKVILNCTKDQEVKKESTILKKDDEKK